MSYALDKHDPPSGPADEPSSRAASGSQSLTNSLSPRWQDRKSTRTTMPRRARCVKHADATGKSNCRDPAGVSKLPSEVAPAELQIGDTAKVILVAGQKDSTVGQTDAGD